MESLKRNGKRLFSVKTAKKVIICLLITFSFQLLISPVPLIVEATFNKAQAKEADSEDIPEGEYLIKRASSSEVKVVPRQETESDQDEEDAAELARAPRKERPDQARLPEIRDKYQVKEDIRVTATAYNSEVGQCSGDPCITASGFNVCEHGIENTVATNGLPLGTKIKIPEWFGERVFVVRDRMNARYDTRIDVWMLNKEDAKRFGIKRGVKVEIVTER